MLTAWPKTVDRADDADRLAKNWPDGIDSLAKTGNEAADIDS